MRLPGTPSDEVGDVLATGRGDITHHVRVHGRRAIPTGRTPNICGGTPSTTDPSSTDCRPCAPRCGWCPRRPAVPHARRATSRYDAIDHVMTYFFTDSGGLTASTNSPRRSAVRTGSCLCCRRSSAACTTCRARSAAPRVKVGADVLPWWPVAGVYLLLERATTPPTDLVDVDGVGGVWSATSQAVDASLASATARPVHHVLLPRRRPGRDRGAAAAGARRTRWSDAGVEPLLAAPFHPVVPLSSGIAMCRRRV